MLEGIVFDMDGVLFDTERLFRTCWYQTAEEMKIPVEHREELINGGVGLNHNDTRVMFAQKLGKAFPFEEFTKRSAKRFHALIDREGLPIKEGLHEILDYLATTDLKVGIASSSITERVYKHLEKTGLTQCFSVIIGGDKVEHSKPQPDIYLKACEELGVNPCNSIAIEDSPNGIKSAYAAGMKVIMIPDMIEATTQIDALLYCKLNTLLEMKEYLIRNKIP
ncbi:MAG: HAD family phosphatase [Lachnospiraceae bacterium]